MGAPALLVGRHRELEQLSGFLDRMQDGLQVCVLTGVAGIGKTTVWRRGVELAPELGYRVLSARSEEAEGRLAYVGLSDLVAGVEDEWFQRLPGVQRRALDVALLRREAGEATVDARAIASGVLSLLRDLAAGAPVLVAVDDAHWLDVASASVLAFALRRLEGVRVGVLAAVRTEGTPVRAFVDALPAESRVEVRLPPLSVASVHAILQRELGWTLPRPTLVKVVEASGGNAFYALEIARELERLGEPSPGEGLPVPAELQALVRARLARLPAETGEALLAAACSSVAHATLVGEAALGPAEEAQIVRVSQNGRIEFEHPLLAAAIRESASSARRQAVHRRLAGLVDEAEERARHLALASSGPDAEVATELDRAAQLARSRGAPAAAAELAELALRMSPADDRARPERLLVAAALRFDAGDLDGSKMLLDQIVDEVASGPLRARALRLLGLLESRRTGFAAAVELALAGLEAAGDDVELAAEIELDLALYHAWSDDYARGDAHACAAVPFAAAAHNDGLLASALAVRTVLAFLSGRGVAEADLQQALALEDPLRATQLLLRPRFVHGFVLLCTGRVDDALATLDDLRADALEQGRESDAPLLFLYLVWASVWQGDLQRAARFAEQARQAATLLDDRLVDALALSASALAHTYAGDEADQARRDSSAAIEQFERLRWWVGTIWPRWARGLLELGHDNPAGAHEALEPLTDVIGNLGPTDIALSLFLPDLIQALTGLGRREEARTLLEPFAEQARGLDRGWALAAAARCRGQIEAAGTDFARALAAFEEALALYRLEAMPFERARTQLELGKLLRRQKQKRLARLALEEALAVFESLGAPLWAGQARAELARVPTRRAGEGLTATEARIASLAAEGLTNREIAQQAFVSVNTVEANLKRVYRKLGIGSRAQLARALDRRPADTS